MTDINKFKTTYLWLILGMTALFLATILATLLVAGKSPLFGNLFSNEADFQRALVLHVNLNIVLWIGSIASFLWGKTLSDRSNVIGVALAFSGLIFLCISYFSSAPPLLNNYIPVFNSPYFFFGLGLIAAAFCSIACCWLFGSNMMQYKLYSLVDWSLFAMAMLLLASVFVVFISWIKIEGTATTALYFEHLFWGAGHIWQLFSLQVMITIWMTLAPNINAKQRILTWILIVPVAASITGLIAPLVMAPDSILYREFFTYFMRIFSFWIIPLILTIQWNNKSAKHRVASLSAFLFLFGAAIGVMIRGDNLMVPAHYHAITGAINLCMMTFVLLKLAPINKSEFLIRFQMYFYTTAVTFLAGGLAWSGFLGGLRKVTLQGQIIQDFHHMIVLGLMGVGGIMAALAIFLFLGIALLYLGKMTKKSLTANVIREATT